METVDEMVIDRLKSGEYNILYRNELGEKMAWLAEHDKDLYRNYPVKAGTINRLMELGLLEQRRRVINRQIYYTLCAPSARTRTA